MKQLDFFVYMSKKGLPDSGELTIQIGVDPFQNNSKLNKEFKVLEWLLHWGISDSNSLKFIGITQGHLTRLCKDQYLIKTATGYRSPKQLYSLESKGAEKLAEKLGSTKYTTMESIHLNVYFDSDLIKHSLQIQRLSLLSWKNKYITGIAYPKNLDSKSVRQSYCVWIANKTRIGIALESKIRLTLAMNDFMFMIAKSLSSQEDNILKLDRFVIFCTEEYIAKDYLEQIAKLKDQLLPIWLFDEQQKATLLHKVNIAFSILSRISVIHYKYKETSEYELNEFSNGENIRDFFNRL